MKCCREVLVKTLFVQVKNQKLHFLSNHSPLTFVYALKGDCMVYAVLSVEFALLSLCLGGSKLVFLHYSVCDFSLLCKGQIQCFSIVKCMPLEEKQAQHSEDLASVSDSALVCVGEHIINIL